LIFKETKDIKHNVRHLSETTKNLKKTHNELNKTRQSLKESRPLISNLFTDGEEIMELAIKFIKDAKEIRALGTISTIIQKKGKNLLYIQSTLGHITEGNYYSRIIDFDPKNKSNEEIKEIKQNVKFFKSLYTLGGKNVDLHLYHNPSILSQKGAFHFRVSDKNVVIRTGGHGNKYANAAISITENPVIEQFKNYYISFINYPESTELTEENLGEIENLFKSNKFNEISRYLKSINWRGGEPD
jgi:hypothetical protein